MIQIKTFSEKVLFEADVGSLKLCLEAAVKAGARLNGASLDGASLDGASLDGASLDGASLDWARLNGARLNGASLDGASLDGASLDGASLDGASLDGASLDWARLNGAKNIRRYGPVGAEGRMIFAVTWKGGVKFQIGCFWGMAADAKKAVAEKYGESSIYFKMVCLMEESLMAGQEQGAA